MSKELDLLSVLKNREHYANFSRFVDTDSLSDLAQVVVKSLGQYLESKEEVEQVDWGKFRTWFMVIKNPSMKAERKALLNRLFDKLEEHEPDPEFEEELLTHFIDKDVCSEVVDRIIKNDGVYDLHHLAEMIAEGIERRETSEKEDDDSVDLEDLISKLVTTDGYPMKLSGYKESIGKARGCDLVVIAGRPESGKTSHAIDQFVDPVLNHDPEAVCLFFNNEEDGDKIRLRDYQVVLGQTGVDIARDVLKSKDAYLDRRGRRFKVIDDPGMTVSTCEALCKKHKPKVIVFNVLDKIYGFTKTTSNDVDRVRRLAQWARKLAKTYDAVVVCICQADGSVEGERWFGKDKVYGSKTGVPGEADILICLGHSHDDKDAAHRFISIAKNKTTGDASVDPTKKHNRFVCAFDGGTGRFTDA